eukprot:scaffold3043_cov320-Alexandrium_tamarense.AAC.1
MTQNDCEDLNRPHDISGPTDGRHCELEPSPDPTSDAPPVPSSPSSQRHARACLFQPSAFGLLNTANNTLETGHSASWYGDSYLAADPKTSPPSSSFLSQPSHSRYKVSQHSASISCRQQSQPAIVLIQSCPRPRLLLQEKARDLLPFSLRQLSPVKRCKICWRFKLCSGKRMS